MECQRIFRGACNSPGDRQLREAATAKQGAPARRGVLSPGARRATAAGASSSPFSSQLSNSGQIPLPRQCEEAFRAEDWAACFQSQEQEFDCIVTDIDGADLEGTLFRALPGSVNIGEQKCKHWLDGDGYIMAFTFQEGRVHFKSKYVETEERQEEQRAGKVLYRNTFGTQPEGLNAGNVVLKNPANTNVVLWGDRLFALWEAGCPYELDPATLETLGKSSMDGWVAVGKTPTSSGSKAVDQALGFGDAHTAHPHVVADKDGSQRLVAWKWNSVMDPLTATSAVQAEFKEFDEQWNPISSRELVLAKSPMPPHDFAVTASSYVLTVPPMNLNVLPYLLGIAGPAECVSMSKSPMRVVVCPRDSPDAPEMVVEDEAVYYIHYANAFDDGDDIVVVGSAWGPEDVQRLADQPRNGILGSWDDVMQGNFTAPVTSLWQHRINRKTGCVQRRLLHQRSMDHPRVNPKHYGRPSQYVYFNGCVSPEAHRSGPPQSWTRLDMATGEAQDLYLGSRIFTEELIFVPREDSNEQEDSGYLLGMLYCAERNRSALAVLDASDFRRGPVCTIWLGTFMPHGLHGFFTPQIYQQ